MDYDIRQSQVIHTWPAGAMIDFPELSLIMLCHDDSNNDWGLQDLNSNNSKQIIKDNRLAEAFKVENFIVPPAQNGITNLSTFGIRFPKAQYCPKCGLIHFISKNKGLEIAGNRRYDQSMSAFKCEECTNNQTGQGPKLVPMRFVIATEEGFLDDFPWDWYVHKNKPEERKKGHKLFYKSKGGSAGLSDIKIESISRTTNSTIATCDLGEIFNQEIFAEKSPVHGHYLQYVNGFLPKPWKGWHNDKEYITELVSNIPGDGNITIGNELTPEAKRKFPRTMQRGAGNIIFPIVYSGILLPESTYEQNCPPEVQQIIENNITGVKDNLPDLCEGFFNDDWRDFLITQVKKNANHGLLKLGYSLQQIIGYIGNHFGADSADVFVNKAIVLRQQEFKAFTGNILNDEIIWFKKRNENGLEYNTLLQSKDLFEEVILLDKLSALKIYKGFTRVKPLMNEELVFAEATDNLGVEQLNEFQRIQDARKNPLHTKELPAVEVKGEGIFLRLNNKTINQWAESYPDVRLKAINDNLTQANLDFNQNHLLINKRYLFLHTFSHIILKELAEDCGYSLSSLSEIIYCSSDEKINTEDEMNGILIYTTTSDAEGSLGGLVEKGQPKYLSSIIKKGIDKARWCSSDPLCITAEHGQGFLGLNLAACYSCVLLPETCCEKMNKYLDRATIVGTLKDSKVGFF